MTDLTRRIEIIVLLAITLAIRVIGLGARSLWGDEIVSIIRASQPLRLVANPLAATAINKADYSPPLYYVFLHMWRLVFTSEPMMRLLSVFLGLAGVVFLYLLLQDLFTDRVFSKRAARIAAVLFALSPFQILYAQEVRVYSLLAMLALASTWAALRAWRRPRPGRWLIYGVVSALGVFTSYTFVLLVFAQTLWVLVVVVRQAEMRRQRLLGWLGAHTILTVTVLPLIPTAVSQRPLDLKLALAKYQVAYRFVYGFFCFSYGESLSPVRWAYTIPGMLAASVLAVSGLWVIWTRSRGADSDPAGWLIVSTLALPFVVAAAMSGFMPKYAMVAWPSFVALLAIGAASMPGNWRAVIVGVVLVVSLVGTVNVYASADFHSNARLEPWRKIADTINSQSRPGDVIVADAGVFILRYYSGAVSPVVQLAPETQWAQLRRLRRSAARIWAVLYCEQLPNRTAIVRWMRKNGEVKQVGRYVRYGATVASQMPLGRRPDYYKIEVYRFTPSARTAQ